MNYIPTPSPVLPGNLGSGSPCARCQAHDHRRASLSRRLRTVGRCAAGTLAFLATVGAVFTLAAGLPVYSGALAGIAAVGIAGSVALRSPTP